MTQNMTYTGLIALSACFLCSCATQQRVAGPSTAGVEAKITEAQRYNAKARTAAQRIEDKAMVIDRYWDTAK